MNTGRSWISHLDVKLILVLILNHNRTIAFSLGAICFVDRHWCNRNKQQQRVFLVVILNSDTCRMLCICPSSVTWPTCV